MQIKYIFLSFFVYALCAPQLFAQKKGIEQHIAQLEKVRTTALLQGDLERLESCLAEDLIFTHSHGVPESKAEFMEAMRIEKYKFSTFDIKPTYYRKQKKMCVVHGTAHIVVFAYGKTYDFMSRYTAVYTRKKRGVWQLAAWQNTKIK